MSRYSNNVEFHIDENFLSKHYSDFMGELVEDLIDDIVEEQITPYDTGATQDSMRKDSQVHKKVAYIQNTTDYAEDIYKDLKRSFNRTKHNSQAQAAWYRKYADEGSGFMADGSKGDIIRQKFANIIKINGGD